MNVTHQMINLSCGNFFSQNYLKEAFIHALIQICFSLGYMAYTLATFMSNIGPCPRPERLSFTEAIWTVRGPLVFSFMLYIPIHSFNISFMHRLGLGKKYRGYWISKTLLWRCDWRNSWRRHNLLMHVARTWSSVSLDTVTGRQTHGQPFFKEVTHLW